MKSILLYKYYLLLFLIIGIIVYFPTFFNGFVWDDTSYIIENTQLHQFNFTIFFDNVFNSYLYRQIPVVYYSLLYSVFGANAFPYHLFGLLLHIIVTSLIFILFNKFFSTKISFILSVLFLVHPINAETVYWISSAHVQMFTVFGLLSLLTILNKNMTSRQIGLLLLSLFLCILTYEFGVLYFFLTLLYLYICKSTQFKKILIYESLVLGLYMVLRIFSNSLDVKAYQGLERPSLVETFLTIPSIVVYYIKTLIYPNHLIIWQIWIVKEDSVASIIFPTMVILLLIFILGWLFHHVNKSKKSTIIYFSLWFFLGMLPLLQILPLHMTVADRWFYFPFIGLLGIMGIITTNYYKYLNNYKSYVIIVLILLIGLYSLRTFYRGFDWKDNITLYTHDLQYQPNNLDINNNLAVLYFQSGDYTHAIPHLAKIASLSPNHKVAYIYLGQIYAKKGDNKKATLYFQKALKEKTLKRLTDGVDIYYLLALAYKNSHAYKNIIQEMNDTIINSSPQINELLFIRAEAFYKMKDYKNAYKDISNIDKNIYDPHVVKLEKKIKDEL